MPDIVDFLPLLVEDIETVRARLDADVNAGHAPEDDVFIDTVQGGLYWDITQGVVQECERLWDFLSTEVPGAAFVTTAWGDYLDEHGAVIGVPRKAANPASGEVTFTGTDVSIGSGYKVLVPQIDADTPAIEFETLVTATITGAGTVTVPVQATETGSRGNVAAGTVTVMLTALEGLTSVTNEVAMSSGADVESDETYRNRLLVEYSSRQGAGSQDDYERWSLDYPGVGGVSVVPLWAGAGTVRIVVVDNDSNPVSSVVRDGLQNHLDPASASTVLDGGGSPVTLGGTITVDDTTGFTSAGYIYVGENGVYERVKYTGLTSTTFTGCTGGSGVYADGVKVVQRGHGLNNAPIGHEVTVDTPTAFTVDVGLTVDLEESFTLDGDNGTSAVRPAIDAAIRSYIDALKPGQDVLLNRVEARILTVRGVYNVGTASTVVTLNAVSDDLAIADEDVAITGTITMAEF